MSTVDMKPVIVPFRGVVRGATLRFAYDLTEPDPTAEPNEDGSQPRRPLDLTGVTSVFIVKDSPGDQARQLFRIAGQNQSPLADGRVVFERSAAAMLVGNANARNEWYYEVWVTEPTGDRSVPFAGPFELEPAAKTT